MTKTQISELYVSIFNRASEKEGNQYWMDQNLSAAETATKMLDTDAAKAYFGTSLDTNEAFVEHIYNTTLNKGGATVDAAGKAGWVAKLDAGQSKGEMVAELVAAIADYKIGGSKYATADQATKDAAQQFVNRVEVSDYTATTLDTIKVSEIDSTLSFDGALNVTANTADVATAKAAIDVAAEAEGDTFALTSNQDVVSGTDANDTFYSYVGQNAAGTGAITNSLATGDVVNGKGGSNDTLIGSLINDETTNSSANFAVMPVINDVENIRIQALENSVLATANNVDTVVLDADHITAENHYASDSSRTDFVITNVDIESTQITNDITLEMKDTQQFSDFEVYFNQQDLKAAPDEVVGSASVTIQVADGAQVTGTTTPLINMTFDLSFTQGTNTYSFDNIESTDGTYAGLVTAIQVALAADGLTQYSVALDGTFGEFTTNTGKSVNLDYTGNYITITDNDKNEFTDITFAPEQKAGSEVAILLAQSEVNAEAKTISSIVESTITVDNVGRGSNGGEIVIGSTSSSNSSTGVERINVIVENSSVVSDISSTNDALDKITLTNGTVKGDFVLTNSDLEDSTTAATSDADNYYGNVDQANLVKNGLTSIIAKDFDGDIVLGRDNNLVDLGTLSAAVNGDVTYNATLNDSAAYTATTGNGADTINITLDDNIVEADGSTNTSVTISTGAANDMITVNEDNTTAENTTATIDAGSGNDVVYGNDVSVTVTAGSGDDVVYAENTGVKAMASIATSGLYTSSTAATQIAASVNTGTIHWLAGSQVQVTIATNGAAADLSTGATQNGYDSGLVTITPASGTLTTLADLNAAVVEAINEDSVLSKLAFASIDEDNNVVVQYLVDGTQVAGSVELNVTTPATFTISTTAQSAYEDLVNDSTAVPTGTPGVSITTATASANTFEANELTVVGIQATGAVVNVTIGDEVIAVTMVDHVTAGAVIPASLVTNAADIAAALNAAGYIAYSDGTDTVGIITNEEVSADVAAYTVASNQTVNATNYTDYLGTDSDVTANALNAANTNEVNGNSGDDVIVLSSDATGTVDTVVWTDYSQGDDTIVHFETTIDSLDFTSYLTGTVDANNTGSTSTESEIDLTVTTAANDTFTANSINLIDFNADLSAITTETFATLTAAQVEALLDADASANTVLTAAPGDLYQTNGVSVLVIHDDSALDEADGSYKAYEVSYTDATVAAAVANTFSVKLIGSFDLGDTAAPSTLALGDFTL